MELKGYKIGDIAKRLNISARTVRYYEELGLISTERTVGGFRLYSPSQLERIQTILALKEIGMPLEEIGALLHLRHSGAKASETSPALLEFLGKKRAELLASIEKYTAIIKEIDDATKIVEANCCKCSKSSSSSTCCECVDKKTEHHTPPLLKTLL